MTHITLAKATSVFSQALKRDASEKVARIAGVEKMSLKYASQRCFLTIGLLLNV